MKQSISLPQAEKIANEIVSILQPLCQHIHIAGSVRRKVSYVGDIEICCRPNFQNVKDLFGWNTAPIVDLNFQQLVFSLGKINKGNPDGRFIQIELPEKIQLDLFMPTEEDYFRQFAIRTGSSLYSHRLIASGWRKMGWVGTSEGLRRQTDCECKETGDKPVWHIINPHGEKPPVWQSEEEFFAWLGIEWVEPEKRII